jgi:hypothetical protein
MEFLVGGLDLGKASDFSVLSVVSRRALPVPVAKRRYSYALRWLQAWELGTKYTATRPGERSVIGDIQARFNSPALAWAPLAVDYTGVGMAVVEQVQAAKVKARLHPVMITGGHTVSTPQETKDRSWHVPKVELVGTLVVLLENGLLTWERPDSMRALPLIGRFEKELAAFREFVTRKKNVTYGAETSQHDDIVLSVALACFLAERVGTGDPAGIGLPADDRETGYAGSVLADAPPGVFPERPGATMHGRYGPG